VVKIRKELDLLKQEKPEFIADLLKPYLWTCRFIRNFRINRQLFKYLFGIPPKFRRFFQINI
jgi:hypothetical protein